MDGKVNLITLALQWTALIVYQKPGRHTDQAEKVFQPDTNQNQRRKHIIKEAQGEDACASEAVMLPVLARYTSHTLDKHTGPQEQWLILWGEKKAPA